MVTNRTQHHFGVRDCEFTFKGENLVTFRRAKLRGLAKALGLPAEGTKQDLLRLIMAKLRSSDSPKELSGI